MTELSTLDIQEILHLLPHRFPFLLVDRVLSYEPGVALTAIKNVTVNEPCFTGHFPDCPIMPGVLIIEAMAQATGLLAFKTQQAEPDQSSLYYLAGVDKARFKAPVVPGDQLRMEVKLLKERRGLWRFATQALVDGAVVASAEMMCVEKKGARA